MSVIETTHLNNLGVNQFMNPTILDMLKVLFCRYDTYCEIFLKRMEPFKVMILQRRLLATLKMKAQPFIWAYVTIFGMEYLLFLRIISELYIVFLSFHLPYVDWQHHAPAAGRSLPVVNCIMRGSGLSHFL